LKQVHDENLLGNCYESPNSKFLPVGIMLVSLAPLSHQIPASMFGLPVAESCGAGHSFSISAMPKSRRIDELPDRQQRCGTLGAVALTIIAAAVGAGWMAARVSARHTAPGFAALHIVDRGRLVARPMKPTQYAQSSVIFNLADALHHH
jgi:hypothetical protein